MYIRKDAVFMAVAGLLASAGFAVAAEVKTPTLSLEPTVITAQADVVVAPQGDVVVAPQNGDVIVAPQNGDVVVVGPTASRVTSDGLLMQGLGRVGVDRT